MENRFVKKIVKIQNKISYYQNLILSLYDQYRKSLSEKCKLVQIVNKTKCDTYIPKLDIKIKKLRSKYVSKMISRYGELYRIEFKENPKIYLDKELVYKLEEKLKNK